jgi:hypothetical protein
MIGRQARPCMNHGAGCGLTRVGAGEEQERKVVAGEASRCGEDK